MANPEKRRDPQFWSTELDFLLNVAPAQLGMRGTTAAVISAIERGGAAVAADHEWIRDEQIGYGKAGLLGRNAVARARLLEPFWAALPAGQRELLRVHYEPRQVPGKAASYLYAPDRKTSLASVTLALCSPEERRQLLDCAARLERMTTSQLAHEGRQYGKTIRAMVQRAILPVSEAHGFWNALRRDELEAWLEGAA